MLGQRPLAAHGLIDANGNIGADGTTLYLSFMQQPNGTTSFYEFPNCTVGSLGHPGRIGGVGNDMGSATTVNLRTGGAQTPIGPGSTNVSFYVLRIDYHNGNDDVRVYPEPHIPHRARHTHPDHAGRGRHVVQWNLLWGVSNNRTVQQDEVRLGLDVATLSVIPFRSCAWRRTATTNPPCSWRLPRITPINCKPPAP